MAIALVQTATQVNVAASSSTTPSITITGTTGGNALTAFCVVYDGNTTFTLTSVTDGGNTWVSRQGNATRPTDKVITSVAVAVDITGGDRTVAFNLSGTSGGSNRYYVLGCLEWSGVKTSSAEDTFDINEEIDTSGATDVSAGPITTTDAADVLVGLAGFHSVDTNLNLGSPTSWTNSYRQNDGNSYAGMDAGYWLPGAIQTTYTAQWSHDNNVNDLGVGVVVALLADATAPAGPAFGGHIKRKGQIRPRPFAPGIAR